jgi:hypothetical protein
MNRGIAGASCAHPERTSGAGPDLDPDLPERADPERVCSPTGSSMSDTSTGLIARHRELDLLDRLLQDVRSGACRFVTVTGEPGIGKTSLLRELVRRAERAGCLTLAGRAAELERELPFGVLVEAFDEYLESLDKRSFEQLAADGLADLAHVFPAMGALSWRAEAPLSALERFRTHHAVRELLERLAAARPLVVVLDDLHWADGASLELLASQLRRPPQGAVLIALAWRSGQADRAFAAAAESSASGTGGAVLELQPLSLESFAGLLGPGPAAVHRRLHERTGGNPFYALQLWRARGGSGELGPDEDLPAAIRAAIGSELGRLSAPARQLAQAAAVAGDPFELDLAVAAAGVDEADALPALDELAEHDLVRTSRVPRRFHFRHPLVRSAVYAATSPGARLGLHARTAAALAERGASAAVRAHHIESSARHGDPEALSTLTQAGHDDSQRAPRSAERWFEGALRILPARAPDAERIELLVALARARGDRTVRGEPRATGRGDRRRLRRGPRSPGRPRGGMRPRRAAPRPPRGCRTTPARGVGRPRR